jgi:hypothetical protein
MLLADQASIRPSDLPSDFFAHEASSESVSENQAPTYVI